MTTSDAERTSNAISEGLLEQFVRAGLDDADVQRIQSAPKDQARFEAVLEAERRRLGDQIVLPLQEHLYVVEADRRLEIACDCGHIFGPATENWKLAALVYERDPSDGSVLAPVRSADPDWMILREFYCPGCGAQLEVEAVPPGHPFVFSALPALEPDA